MSLIKPAFLKKPFTAVKDRSTEIDLLMYETYDRKTNTGELRDLEGHVFVADFLYSTEDNAPIFTLSSDDSPPGIIINPEGGIKLLLDSVNTDLVLVPERKTPDFPFVPVIFELKGYDPDGNKISAVFGTVNFYYNVTRSDD